MPPTYTDDGLRAARSIRARHPRIAVVVLTQHGEAEYATQLAQELGDRAGYLLKERATSVEELLATIERVVAGELVIDPEVVRTILRRPRIRNPLDELTVRERQTLSLVAEGRSTASIATELHIGVATVETHVASVRRKLGLHADPGGGAASARVVTVLTYLRHAGRLVPPVAG
jgi:DNA-binding NarL/FixJ family response regulator